MTSTPSLIVVAYRKPDALASLLASLDLDDLEIVVVNVSADPAVRAIATSATRPVHVVDADNRGFAAGVNLGVAASTGDIVIIANDDVSFCPGCLATLVQGVIERGGICAPRVLDIEGAVQSTVAATVSLGSLVVESALLPDHPIWLPFGWAGRIQKWRVPSSAEKVPGVAAAVIAGHRRLLTIRPLPEQYFMYWEERDWFSRLERGGVPVWYLPDAEIVHEGGRAEVRPQKQRWLAANAIRCVRSLDGNRAGAAARIIVLGWQLRLAVQSVLRPGRSWPLFRARLAGVQAALAPVPDRGEER